MLEYFAVGADTRTAAPGGYDFTHETIDAGGIKYPSKTTLRAHDPETGELAGELEYHPPKRKGAPAHVIGFGYEDRKRGAGSALLNEMEQRHPGSRVVWMDKLHEKNKPKPGDPGFNPNRDYGKPTDWDTHFPKLPGSIHRGMGIPLSPGEASGINDSGVPASEQAHTLYRHVRDKGAIGMHWSADPVKPHQFAFRNALDPRTDIPVVLHAQTPERKSIETRPDVLRNKGVWPHDHSSGDAEVPVRKRQPVTVTGISWLPDVEHPEADESGWVHHTFEEPKQHHASLGEGLFPKNLGSTLERGIENYFGGGHARVLRRSAGRGKPRHSPTGGDGGEGAPGPVGGGGGASQGSQQGAGDPTGGRPEGPRPVEFHPAAHKELKSLDKPVQRQIMKVIDDLSNDRPTQTHALTMALKGWNATKASRGHRIVHQPTGEDGGIHVGYIGLHEYGQAIRRLTSLERKSGPVTFPYLRNTEGAPNLGSMYGQDVEPHGRYLTYHAGPKPEGDRWETGEVSFENPLHLDYGTSSIEGGNWKHRLSEQYGGKRGKALSQAVRRAGHDAIITHDEYGPREIVDLTGGEKTAVHDPHSHVRRGDGTFRSFRNAWGASRGSSTMITGASAHLMGLPGYVHDDEEYLSGTEKERLALAHHALHVIHKSPGADEPLYHGTRDSRVKDLKLGDEIRLPLTAASGGRTMAESFAGIRGGGSIVHFPKGTPFYPHSEVEPEYRDEDMPERWSEAITAGHFRVKHHYTEDDGTTHVHLEHAATFNPHTKGWEPAGAKTAAQNCGCCGGTGEHETGHECYHCDASGTPDTQEQAQPFCADVFRDRALHDQGCPHCGSRKEAGAQGDLPEGLHFKIYPSGRNGGSRYHAIDAHLPGEEEAVGSIMWDSVGDENDPSTIPGEVFGLRVHPKYRRRGVANALWDHAVMHGPSPMPQHSLVQTPEGGAWAQQREAKRRPRLKSRVFGPTKGVLDPRLFQGDQMRPEVRTAVLSRLGAVLEPILGEDWQRYIKVYLAGSEASEWFGNSDFDTLLGVDYDHLKGEPGIPVADLDDADITDMLNTALRVSYNASPWKAPFGGEWDLTGYVNAGSYDIRKIKPYAAYDLSADTWAVRPPHLPEWHFEQHPLYKTLLGEMKGYADAIEAIDAMPEPFRTQQGRALWEHLHADRGRAFSDEGGGWDDPGNLIEKALVEWGLWDKLVDIRYGEQKTAAKGEYCETCKTEHDYPFDENDHYRSHTDWDSSYPRLRNEIHRGMAVRLSPETHDVVHGDRPESDRAHALLHEVTAKPLGMHWTDADPEMAGRISEDEAQHLTPRDRQRTTHVILHADTPAREHVEDDIRRLVGGSVISRQSGNPEGEVPLKENAPVNVWGVSWKHHTEPGWHFHELEKPVTKTAGRLPDLRFEHLPPEENHSYGGARQDTHTLHAYLGSGDTHVGELSWFGEDGMIRDVDVHPEHRRQGIASELLRRAREIQPEVHHSGAFTPDGKAWSEKTAGAHGELPEGVTFEHKPSRDGLEHSLIAFHPEGEKYGPFGKDYAGHLTWWDDDGEISGANVVQPLQRRGLATELLRRAKEITPHIRHAPEKARTNDGAAWIKSMGSGPLVEHVRIDKLWPHREWNHAPGGYSYERDGGGPYGWKHDQESWDTNRDSVASEGIREPLTLEYNPGQHAAYLGEGNHRLHWAKELGHETVPVRVWRTSKEMHPRYELPGQVDKFEGQHVPQELKPSDILPQDWFPAAPQQRSEAMLGYFTAADESADYRMQHRPPDSDYGAPLHDLAGEMSGSGIYPKDIYTHSHYYLGGEPGDSHSMSVAQRVKGKPEARVRIYRAMPAEYAHQGFRPGDWVSTSKEYAREHSQHHEDSKHDWPVISTTVPAKHLHTDGNSICEYGFNGPETKPASGVAFKGGYHQEVRMHADGVVRPVTRRAAPEEGSEKWGSHVLKLSPEDYEKATDIGKMHTGEAAKVVLDNLSHDVTWHSEKTSEMPHIDAERHVEQMMNDRHPAGAHEPGTAPLLGVTVYSKSGKTINGVSINPHVKYEDKPFGFYNGFHSLPQAGRAKSHPSLKTQALMVDYFGKAA